MTIHRVRIGRAWWVVQRSIGWSGNYLDDELMDFRIADTFIDSLTKLTGEAQKSAKTVAFDLG